jgi:hypothetical protein
VKGTFGLGARVDPLEDGLPTVNFQWDAETEILSGTLDGLEGTRGLTGSVELEDRKGSVITLDFQGGVMRALEVVVWPQTKTVEGLAPPEVSDQGRYVVPARPSQPGVAVIEADVPLSAERNADESVVHLRVGMKKVGARTQLADHLSIELDDEGELAGFWLLAVPPFPEQEGTR